MVAIGGVVDQPEALKQTHQTMDSVAIMKPVTKYSVTIQSPEAAAGFRSPPYAQGIGLAGLHLHFIREDKQAGGHALNCRIRSGRIQLVALHGFHVELPTSAAFSKANFEQSGLDDKIEASEG